jgi:ATP-dependent helicase/nuclease subunit B
MKTEASGMEVVRTVFTGDFHPALEDALLEHLAERIGAAPLAPVPVIVPTNFLGRRLSRLLADRTGGHANVQFMTLRGLAAFTAPSPLPDGRSPLPTRADAVVVRRLMDEGEARDGYFSSIADRPGLSTAILAAIRDLKEASYDPDSFAETARTQGLLRSTRHNKFAELSRIWGSYEKRLEGGRWADDSDIMRAAAEALETGGRAPEPLTVYGFYDLNALQKRLLGACIELTGAVVYFPYSDAPAFSYARPTLDWFLSLGFTRIGLASDSRAIPLPESTLIMSAPGEAREARETVRALVRILGERDLSLQDVAIAMRSPVSYSDHFAEEFGRLGSLAPDGRGESRGRSFLEKPPPLSRTRSGRSLLRLALAARSDFARSDVIEFLSLADLDAAAFGGKGEAPVSDWNAASAIAGVTSGVDAWIDRLRKLRKRLAESDADDPFAEAHGCLAESIDCLLRLTERMSESFSVMPARAAVPGYLDLLCGFFRDVTRPSDGREIVVAAAERMREIASVAGTITFTYFVELLRAYLDAPAGQDARFGTGGPSVLSVMSARGLSYRVVVIPGLVEREFPLRHRQDPILLDADREKLNAGHRDNPLRTLPLRASGTDEERLLFRLAVSAATDVVVLTYPRLDPATARPRVPSIFVLDVLREITGRPHDYDGLEASEHIIRIPLSRRFPAHRMEALTRDEFDGCSILEAVESGRPESIAYLLNSDAPLLRRLEMEETRWTNPFFTRYDGALTSEESLAAARTLAGFTPDGPGPGQILSATTLEEYATCPFRFLMRRVLRIDPVEEPEDILELSPLDRGSLYHVVLERFLKRMRSQGRLPLSAASREDLFEIADGLTRSGPWGLAGYAGARLLEFRALALNLAVWLNAELLERGGFVPSYFEARFGGRTREHDDLKLSTKASVPFDAAEGVTVEFGGKIDRIDVSADRSRARVIDYKTGRPPSRKPVLDGGRRLQLPVYLIASRAMLAGEHPDAVVESAEYRYVAAGHGAQPLRLTAEELDGRADDLRAAICLILKGITSGMFFPYPQDRACGNCEYARACGSTALKLASMKNGDRRARFFTEGLAEIE